MKRIIIIAIITCLLIPFFAIDTFSSSYDLGIPTLWTSPYPITDVNPYPTYLPDYPLGAKFFLLYYDQYKTNGGFQDHYKWSVKTNSVSDIQSLYDSISYKIRDSELDYSKPALAFGIESEWSMNNTLVIPGLEYNGVYWPTENQVIKIEFYVDTFAVGTTGGIPSAFHDYISPEDLCFFTCTAGESDTANMSLLALGVHFDSVVVSPSLDSRKIKFTYYFNAYGSAFSDLKRYVDNHYPGSTLSLVVRFPYYFGSNSKIKNGAYIVSNANLPVSYELMTPGDYSQELGNIKNAITESNEKLMDYYDTLSGEDQAVIVHAKQQNDKLDSSIKDYDNAQSGIDKIVQNVELPDYNLSDTNDSFDAVGIGNFSTNGSIWTDVIVQMAVIVFTFGAVSLILFGKKG